MKKTQMRSSAAAILLAMTMGMAAVPAHGSERAQEAERGAATATNDVRLSALRIEPGELRPEFVSSTVRYEGEVPGGTQYVSVNATANDAQAEVKYETSEGMCLGSLCEVGAGTTWVTVTVTAADLQTRGEYWVEVRAGALSADAALSGLEIEPGELMPGFVSGTTAYEAEVTSDAQYVSVNATANDAQAEVKYETSGGTCLGSLCEVGAGTTWVTVTVTAADGETKRAYGIAVKSVEGANGMSDASLLGLMVMPGELKPEYVSGTTRYEVEVPAGTKSVMVTGLGSNAGVRVEYETSAGTCDVGMCEVAGPRTWVTVTVQSANERVTREYGIEVKVALSTDAELSGLEVRPGELTPGFVRFVEGYEVEVPARTREVEVRATARDAGAKVAYETSAGTCDGGMCEVTGPRTWMTVTVTAANGETVRAYGIEVRKVEAGGWGWAYWFPYVAMLR